MSKEDKDMLRTAEEDIKLNTMAEIRRIAQKAIERKGITEEQVRKSLGSRRYEKKN